MPARSSTKARRQGKPIVVSIGRNSVSIYPRPPERGRGPRWLMADYSTGKRRWRTFASEKEARSEAARTCARLNAGDQAGAGMTGDERRDLIRATDIVAPFNVDLGVAAAIFAEAAALVGHENIVAACKAYARRSPASRTPVPVGKAVLEYIEAKESKDRSPRHVADLRSRLSRFAAAFPKSNLGDLTTASVQGWIDRLTGADGEPLAALTKRNFAAALSGLFEHFRRRGSIESNPCGDLERDPMKRSADVAFWTPEQAAKVLAAVSPAALPALVVGLFAGCRTAELCRLRWGDVDIDAGHVVIGSSIAKTASRRLAPLPENAREWLRPLRGTPEEPLFAGDDVRLSKEVSEACRTAGVPRIANAARHSAITYAVAQSGDVPRAALQFGNSAAVIHAHYRGLAPAEQAQRFFAIMPPASTATASTTSDAT